VKVEGEKKARQGTGRQRDEDDLAEKSSGCGVIEEPQWQD